MKSLAGTSASAGSCRYSIALPIASRLTRSVIGAGAGRAANSFNSITALVSSSTRLVRDDRNAAIKRSAVSASSAPKATETRSDASCCATGVERRVPPCHASTPSPRGARRPAPRTRVHAPAASQRAPRDPASGWWASRASPFVGSHPAEHPRPRGAPWPSAAHASRSTAPADQRRSHYHLATTHLDHRPWRNRWRRSVERARHPPARSRSRSHTRTAPRWR